jgi:hypothetical protein
MKQTAVEWLYEQILLTPLDIRSINKCLEQAKEMEKDQICEAYAIGGSPLLGPWEFGEEYYNETFNK